MTARINTARGIACRIVAEMLPTFANPVEPTLEDAYIYLIEGGAVMSFFSCQGRGNPYFSLQDHMAGSSTDIVLTTGGYSLYQPAVTGTQASQLIANPVLAGALIGAVLFALLTLFELNRVHESQMASLTDTLVSPIILNTARVVAVLMVATAAGLLTMVAYYPYTATKMGHIFEPELYFASFLILMLPSLWLGSLFAAVFYQITRRVDISFMLIAACVLLSMSQFFHGDFILRWANPSIPVYSDDFSNALALRMALYSRLFWLIVLAGLWFLSTLFIRRYEKGALGSLVYNMREFRVIPLLVVVFLASGVAMYMYQPFVNHSPFEPEFFD